MTTAMKIYDVEAEGVTDDMRWQARRSTSVSYTASLWPGERLDINRFEAAELIKQYFAQYPGLKDIDETQSLPERRDVENMTCRRRYLRINSRNGARARERAQRNQYADTGSADMIKPAMSRYEEPRGPSKMLCRHDVFAFDLHMAKMDSVPPK